MERRAQTFRRQHSWSGLIPLRLSGGLRSARLWTCSRNRPVYQLFYTPTRARAREWLGTSASRRSRPLLRRRWCSAVATP